MMYEKLKGIVKDDTLMKIIHEKAIRINHLPEEKRIFFDTNKSTFVAERKSMMYWRIYQIFGEAEISNEEERTTTDSSSEIPTAR